MQQNENNSKQNQTYQSRDRGHGGVGGTARAQAGYIPGGGRPFTGGRVARQRETRTKGCVTKQRSRRLSKGGMEAGGF